MSVIDNPLMKNVRGALGQTVYFRQRFGKTEMCNMPTKPDKSKETDAQRATRYTFREAAYYAKNSLKDPAQKAYYERQAKKLNLPNAYTAALTDYMRKGKIGSVSRKRYTGKVGGEIMVAAEKKDFSAWGVPVSLSAITREPIEQRLSVKNTGRNCIYRNTVDANDADTVVLKAKVIDLARSPCSDTPLMPNLNRPMPNT